MIGRLSQSLTRFSHRWVPDPFAIAILLTLLTFLLTGALTDHHPLDLLGFWGGRLQGDQVTTAELGFWRLLAFGMQMCLILVTGFALASTGPVRKAVTWLAERPRTAGGAIALTAVVAMLAALINWGLGLIVGALLARDMGRSMRARGVPVHYPLLGAAGYTGLMVWHGGLSGTAPFKVTQRKDIVELALAPDLESIPLGETVFSPMNLAVLGVLLVFVPLVLARMSPARVSEAPLPAPVPEPGPAPERTPASRLESSWLLAWVTAAITLVYAVRYLNRIGWDRADVNVINLVFLAVGLALHGSPRAYGKAIEEATRGCAGIILQFPFYAGIMALMHQSGLMTDVAQTFAAWSTDATFGPLTFLSAGAVNLFVPSGGGQWGVQGAVVLQSAYGAGVPLGKAVMAFAYGDGWTNMLQPFWALPLLGITGLKARELIGYTATLMLLVGPIYLGALALF